MVERLFEFEEKSVQTDKINRGFKELDKKISISSDGWTATNERWAYASADSPTFTITVPSGATDKYSAGMRIKLTQTTVKYFIITAVADTVLTVYGGTDYTLANAAITVPYYSIQKAPFGFPLDPTKWTVELTDTTLREQSTPTVSTWYNIGTTACQITIPIGIWRISYQVCLLAYDTSGTQSDMSCALSTANNSASDADLVARANVGGASGTIVLANTVYREKHLVVASKTLYYLNGLTVSTTMEAIRFQNDSSKLIIRAICAYL